MSAAGGGGGTPLKVLFEILGIDEAKSQLQSLIPEVEKIGSAAETTGGRMKVLGDSLRESGDAGQALSPIADNLDEIGAANERATSSITDLTKATEEEIKVVEDLDTVNKERVTTQEDIIKKTEDLVKTETDSVATKEELVKSTDKLNTEMTETSTTTDKAAQSADKLEKSSQETTTALDKEGKSIKSLGTEAQKGGQSMDKLEKETKQSGDASEQTGKKNEGLKANMTALMGSAVSLAGGVTALWQTYDSLGDAQLKVDKATAKLSAAQEVTAKAQEKVNQLIAEGKTGTPEYTQAVLDLEQAKEKERIKTEDLTNAQEDFNIVNAQFYQNIGPELISVFGSIAMMIGTVATTAGQFKAKFAGMATDFMTKIKGMQAGSLGLHGTLKMIGLTNPFFIALTVGAGIMAAFVTNVFGLRDAINGIGVALGNVLGPLKPFLTMIGQLGEGLVNIFGMGGEAQKAYASETEEAMAVTGEAFSTASGVAVNSIEAIRSKLNSSYADIQKYTEELKELRELQAQPLPTPGSAPTTAPKQGPSSPTSTPDEGMKPVTVDTSKLNIGEGYKKLLQDVKVYRDEVGKLKVDEVELTNNLTPGTAQFKYRNDTINIVNGALANYTTTEEKFAKTGAELVKLEKDKSGALVNTSSTVDTTTKSVEKMTEAEIKNNLATAQAEYQSSLFELTQKKLTDSITDTQIELDLATKQLSNNALMNQTVEAATLKQALAQKQAQLALIDTVAGLNEYNRQLETTEGKVTAQLQGRAKQLDTFVKEKAAVQENIGVYAELKDQLAEGEIQVIAYEKAYGDTMIKIAQGVLEVQALRGETDALTASLASGEAQNIAYNKGLAEQERQIKLDIIANEELAGQLKGLKDQWASGEAQLTSFNNGITNQAIAFENQKKAIMNSIGMISQMRKEYSDGYATAVAFNQGVVDTALAFEEQKLAIDKNMGSLKQAQTQYAQFNGFAVAFREGFTQTELEMANAQRATDAMIGSVSALIISIYEGEAGLQAYNQGFAESEKAFYESITAVDKLRGSLDAMQQRLGMEQVNAFAEGVQQMRQNLLDTDIATANTYGQIEHLQTTLSGTYDTLARFDSGFASSYKSMVEWAAGIDTAKGSASGAKESFAEMQQTLGVQLPQGFNLSRDAAKEWIEVNKGVPDSINKVVDAANKAGEALQSSLVEGFRGGSDKLDDEFDKLEEKLGVKLTDSMRKALKPGIFAQSTKQYLEEEFSALQAMKVGTEGWHQMADAMMGKMAESMKQSPHLKEAAQHVTNAIQAVKLDPKNQQAIAQLGLAIQNYGTLAGGSVQPAEQFNAAAGNSVGITKQASALDVSTRFMVAYNAALAANKSQTEAVAAGSKAASDALAATGTNAQTAATGMNSATTEATGLGTEADTTFTKMSTLATALGLLGPATAVAVGRANTEFKELNPTQPSYTTGITKIAQSLSLLPNGISQTVTKSNTSFNTFKPLQPSFVTGMTKIAQALTLLPSAVSQQVTKANTAFGQMKPIQPTFQTQWTALGKMLPTLATTTAQTVTKVNSSWTSMSQVSGRTFTTLVTQSRTASSQVSIALQTMVSKAQTVFRSIASSAATATGGVRALVSAINSMRNKTVTLTTIHRNVYQTIRAAKGFGPAVVSSPMNLLVGEGGGPELVSVTPLTNNGVNRNAISNSSGSSSVTTNRNYSTIRGGSKSNISSALTSNVNSSFANNISNTTISRFNEAVAKITNSFEKQESMMNASHVTSVSSTRNGSVYSSNTATTTNGNNYSYMSSNVPGHQTVRQSSIIRSGGSINGSGVDAGAIIAMVSDIIKQAMSNTTINLNNVTNVDGDKVYEGQKRQFGLRNGAMLH